MDARLPWLQGTALGIGLGLVHVLGIRISHVVESSVLWSTVEGVIFCIDIGREQKNDIS